MGVLGIDVSCSGMLARRGWC